MGYASRSGRAQTSASNPRAFAVCQRCNIWVNHDTLAWQMQYGGAGLINTRLLVCPSCYDTPQPQLRSLNLPGDPTPVQFALVEPFLYDESGNNPPYGQPVGLEQAAVMPLFGTKHYAVPLQVLSVTADGTNVAVVTCSAPHGLVTNDQVAIEGLTARNATGFFSVTVLNPMTLSYAAFSNIAAGALLTTTSKILTALVGLPRGYTTIPQVGP